MIKLNAYFCKCHCYNPVIILDIPSENLPKKIKRSCAECKVLTSVGTRGKEIV